MAGKHGPITGTQESLRVTDEQMVTAYHEQRRAWRGMERLGAREMFKQSKATLIAGLKERKGVFAFEAGRLYLGLDGISLISDTTDFRPSATELPHWNARIARIIARNKERFMNS